jgi:hypothetical protein
MVQLVEDRRFYLHSDNDCVKSLWGYIFFLRRYARSSGWDLDLGLTLSTSRDSFMELICLLNSIKAGSYKQSTYRALLTGDAMEPLLDLELLRAAVCHRGESGIEEPPAHCVAQLHREHAVEELRTNWIRACLSATTRAAHH